MVAREGEEEEEEKEEEKEEDVEDVSLGSIDRSNFPVRANGEKSSSSWCRSGGGHAREFYVPK